MVYPIYSVKISKRNNIKAFVQVTGSRLCAALDGYRDNGFLVESVKKIKGAGV